MMNQIALIQRSYDEVVPTNHMVRIVNQAVEEINLDELLEQHEGGGSSSYHPKMILKALVYSYCKKVYTSRKISAALEENLYFGWIVAENTPDFRTKKY